MQPADTDTKVEPSGKGTKRKPEQDEEENPKRVKVQKRRTWWIYCELKKDASVIQSSAVTNKGPWGYTGGHKAVMKRRKMDEADEVAMFVPRTNNAWIRVKEPEVKGMVINLEVYENHSPGKANYQAKNGDFLVRHVSFAKFNDLESAKADSGSIAYPAHWTRHIFHVCV